MKLALSIFIIFFLTVSCSKNNENTIPPENSDIEEGYEDEKPEFTEQEKRWIGYAEHFLKAFKDADLDKCTAMVTKDFKGKDKEKIKAWMDEIKEHMGKWVDWECYEAVTDRDIIDGEHYREKDPLEEKLRKLGSVMYLGSPLPKHIDPKTRICVLNFHVHPDPSTVKDLQKDEAYKEYKQGDVTVICNILLVKKDTGFMIGHINIRWPSMLDD